MPGLPFLNPKKTVSVIVAKRGKPPGTEVAPEVEAHGHELPEGLRGASEDILQAIDTRSAVDLGKALRRAFEACEKEPHVEGEHIDDDEEGASE